MKESDILFESGDYWVGRKSTCYTVYKSGVTHSESIAAFYKDIDGLSLAIKYCDYCTKGSMSAKEALEIAQKLHKGK